MISCDIQCIVSNLVSDMPLAADFEETEMLVVDEDII
jgi:hypothetical protein